MPGHTEIPDQRFLSALQRAECYPHPVQDIRTLETHISWVFLTGPYAYKIKKAVKLAFLDFSTLDARRRYCEEELRLNRRLAPDIYLEVVAVRGTPDRPRIGGDGAVLDYAVKMRQFSQDALASRVLARGDLTAKRLMDLANRIAAFHTAAPRDPPGECGTPESVSRSALQNFDEIAALLTEARDRNVLAALRRWTGKEDGAMRSVFARRRMQGMVREGHGDLHLGNIVLVGDALIPFDCIEFSDALRWNDVMSEVAFLVMDLMDRGAAELAYLFLNAYLERTGDYEGLGVLRFYLVYRAMVRAKIHLIRAHQRGGDNTEHARLVAAYRTYIALARHCARREKPVLLLMHGLSGSGKSTIATQLMQLLGAIRVRSDVERKRLRGLAAHERSASPVGGGLYTADASRATYERLTAIARSAIDAGYRVLVDAAFLQRWQRARMTQLAEELGIPLLLLQVQAADASLRRRVLQRSTEGPNASEADLQVLDHQLAHQEPLSVSELQQTITLDGERTLGLEECTRIARAAGAPLKEARARFRRLRCASRATP